jgi:hypothetical protein
MRPIPFIIAASLALGSCGVHKPAASNHDIATPVAENAAVDLGAYGSVGADGLFHPSEKQKRDWAVDDAKPTISESGAKAICAKAIATKIGRQPALSLQDQFEDGGRMFVAPEMTTNCFVEKDGTITNLRVRGVRR